MNKKNKKNKGFSLVELIIVIAIMAILAGVMVPQFIKYINESKKSADIQQAQVIYDAIMTQYADDAVNDTTIAVDNAGKITDAVSGLLKISNKAPKSKVKNDSFYYSIAVDANNTVTVKVYVGSVADANEVAPTPASGSAWE